MLKKTPITQYPKFPTSDWLGGEVTHMLYIYCVEETENANF